MEENFTKTIILKGEPDESIDEVAFNCNLPIELDNPVFIMARRINSLFKEDHDIIKIGLKINENPTKEHYAKLIIECMNHLKVCALEELWVDNIIGLDIEFVYLENEEGWNDSLIQAAFAGNPLVREVRTQEHAASGIVYHYVICDRHKLCQFPSGNFADYQYNYTELPQNILQVLNRNGYGFQYCTEV